MPAFRIPTKQQTGVLTIGGVDVTCWLRYVDLPDPSTTEIDVGTFCDPQASVQQPGSRSATIEWVNSFTDGTDGGLYDALLPLADGSEQTFVFQPFGAGTGAPKWEWTSPIFSPPLGQFAPENGIVVSQTFAVNGLTYTAAS